MVENELKEKARKIASGLEETGKKISEDYIPRLVRNVVIITTGGMAIYTLGLALGSMVPMAVPVFVQFGTMLGFMIPLMFITMMISLTMSIVKVLVKE